MIQNLKKAEEVYESLHKLGKLTTVDETFAFYKGWEEAEKLLIQNSEHDSNMNIQEVLSKLCYYDKRNPDCTEDDDGIKIHKAKLIKNNEDCWCDNCFYGRTKMAEYILELLKYEHKK